MRSWRQAGPAGDSPARTRPAGEVVIGCRGRPGRAGRELAGPGQGRRVRHYGRHRRGSRRNGHQPRSGTPGGTAAQDGGQNTASLRNFTSSQPVREFTTPGDQRWQRPSGRPGPRACGAELIRGGRGKARALDDLCRAACRAPPARGSRSRCARIRSVLSCPALPGSESVRSPPGASPSARFTGSPRSGAAPMVMARVALNDAFASRSSPGIAPRASSLVATGAGASAPAGRRRALVPALGRAVP